MRFDHGRLKPEGGEEISFRCLRIPGESGNVTQFVKGLRVVGIKLQFLLQFGLGLVEPLILPIKRSMAKWMFCKSGFRFSTFRYSAMASSSLLDASSN